MSGRDGRMLWAYKAVYKQTNAGGGNVFVLINSTEAWTLIYGQTGPDDYAADRTMTVKIHDEDNEEIGDLATLAVDNENSFFPKDDISATAPDDGPSLEKRLEIGKGDFLRLRVNSMAQNEEITLILRGWIKTTKPTSTTTGSTGTVTTTVGYDKVI